MGDVQMSAGIPAALQALPGLVWLPLPCPPLLELACGAVGAAGPYGARMRLMWAETSPALPRCLGVGVP